MVAMRGVPPIDQTRLAKSELQEAIDSIKNTESGVRSELSTIATQVRRVDAKKAKVTMIAQLKRSRYLRQQLNVLENKRTSLQQHLDTLDTSELNQQVISSVKRTSSALKSLGLDAEQQHLDALFIDMEDQLHGMKSIQQSLSTPMDDSDYDSSMLDQELDMLLQSDEDGYATADSASKLTRIGDVGNQVNTPTVPKTPDPENATKTSNAGVEVTGLASSEGVNAAVDVEMNVAKNAEESPQETAGQLVVAVKPQSTKTKKGVRHERPLQAIVEG